MTDAARNGSDPPGSFLGVGWGFPPVFRDGGVVMTSAEEDIRASLEILFRTAPGERFLRPEYGIDVRSLLFEPMGATLRTFLADRIATAVLIHEPRVDVVDLVVDSPDPDDGGLRIELTYEVLATNSRFNLVFPFHRTDANEARVAPGGPEARN